VEIVRNPTMVESDIMLEMMGLLMKIEPGFRGRNEAYFEEFFKIAKLHSPTSSKDQIHHVHVVA